MLSIIGGLALLFVVGKIIMHFFVKTVLISTERETIAQMAVERDPQKKEDLRRQAVVMRALRTGDTVELEKLQEEGKLD